MSTAVRIPAAVVAGFVAAASLTLAACNRNAGVSADHGEISANIGPLVVDKDELASEVQAQLKKKLGEQTTVNCPQDLDPEVGATTTCTMSGSKGTYDVTVTVTEVEWTGSGNFGVGNAHFDTQVADTPNP